MSLPAAQSQLSAVVASNGSLACKQLSCHLLIRRNIGKRETFWKNTTIIYNPNLESFMPVSVQYLVIWLLVFIVPLAITTDSSCTKRCNMAFTVPMHHNKPNITYLIMYETCIHISQRPSSWYTILCAYLSSHHICIFNFYTLCP